MIDREKVIIRTLERKIEQAKRNNIHEMFLTLDVANEILALKRLKEQAAVKPHHKCIGESYSQIECEAYDFCPFCGRPILR